MQKLLGSNKTKRTDKTHSFTVSDLSGSEQGREDIQDNTHRPTLAHKGLVVTDGHRYVVSEHGALSQCWLDVEAASTTLGRH